MLIIFVIFLCGPLFCSGIVLKYIFLLTWKRVTDYSDNLLPLARR